MAMCLRFTLRQQNYLFQFKIGFLLLCLFFVSLFCILGEWQLYRYHFKKNLLATYQQNLTAAPQSFLTIADTDNPSAFQPVWLIGKYVNDATMFVQNRPYQNQLGYEVLTPIKIAGKEKLLLIDRGWVKTPADEKALPSVNAVLGELRLTGKIKWLNEYQFTLGKNMLHPEQSPLVMQKIDIAEISKLLHQSFYPFILRLDANQPNGFVRDWIITAVEPSRHMGYAVQWFVMAVVLLIAYFSFCFQRADDTTHASK
jgi:surfeit locus 1 family protein